LCFYKKIVGNRKAVSFLKSSEPHQNASNKQPFSLNVAPMVDKKSGQKKASACAGLVAKNKRQLMYRQ
jgi:hypothetical protein